MTFWLCVKLKFFYRKSIQIKPVDLSDAICAFANADGGTIAIGISDKHRRIEGVDRYERHLNELLRTPIDFCNPTVPITVEMVECKNDEGQDDHVLLMHIEASAYLHVNQADEAFIRVGDKSKKLDFNDRMTLMYSKGVRYFEDEPVAGATIEDLDLDFVQSYCKIIGYSKTAEEYVRENKKFVTLRGNKELVSAAAILLFGKNPQNFFPRAYIRFIRFDGVEAKVGKDMNVIKDVTFKGRILDQVEKAIDYIKIQMKEKTYLEPNGIFVTEDEYSEFVRTELVVNAVAHRDYAIKGTDIQIKMFDDRLEVDSPGTLAGMVKTENIRYTHFSRNPKIASFLKDYGYVKEYGEGVERMCKELEALGLPNPSFNNNTFILKTTVMSAARSQRNDPNARIGAENARFDSENARFDKLESWIAAKNASIDHMNKLFENGTIRKGTYSDILMIINDLQLNQVISRQDVQKLLDCKETKALKIVRAMKNAGVIVSLSGYGKGRYVLNRLDLQTKS